MLETYDHLKGIKMNETDTKPELPIHVILRASDYVKIKMQKCPRVGKINQQIAKQNKMAWGYNVPRYRKQLNQFFIYRNISK